MHTARLTRARAGVERCRDQVRFAPEHQNISPCKTRLVLGTRDWASAMEQEGQSNAATAVPAWASTRLHLRKAMRPSYDFAGIFKTIVKDFITGAASARLFR